MADFTRKAKSAEGLLVFTFNRIYTVKGTIYFVSVTGQDRRHHFHMEERSGSWKIVEAPKPPDWLLQLEKELGETISQNHK